MSAMSCLGGRAPTTEPLPSPAVHGTLSRGPHVRNEQHQRPVFAH